MNSSNKIFFGVFWSVIVNLTNALYGFLAVPLLITYFGRSNYGLIALAISINGYMTLLDMGFGSTNVRFFAEWLSNNNILKLKKLFSTTNAFYGLVGIINAIILVVVYIGADHIFNLEIAQRQILRNLLVILMVSSVVNWYTASFNQFIQASENVAWVQKMLLSSKLFTIFSLVLTITLKLSIEQYFFLTIASVWLTIPCLVIKIKKIAPYLSFYPHFDIDTFKEILPYSLNIFSFSIFSILYQSSRSFLLGVESTVGDVADFSILAGIAGIVQSLTGVFCGAILPSSSKAIALKDETAYNKIAYQGTKYVTIFVSFCVFGMCSIASPLLKVYVGDEFLHLTPWLYVFLLTLLSNHILANSSLILGGRNILPLSKMTAVSSLLAISSMWLLIPYYKIGGVVIAMVLYNVMQQLYYYLYYWPRLLHIKSAKILKTSTVPIFFAGGVTCIMTIIIPLPNNEWILIFCRGILFSLVYSFMIFIFMSKNDLIFFKNILKIH